MKWVLYSNELFHHGILGQKWGVRRYQNKDGSLTDAGKRRYSNYSKNDSVFISGKVSYDKPLSEPMKKEVDAIMKAKSKILIGDAPGADTRVQEYLAKNKYKNVVVYTTDETVRNNVGGWEVKTISGKGKTNEREIRRQKDIAMTNESTRGFAIMPEDDRPDSAMSLNVDRLIKQEKPIKMFDFNTNKWVYK
jgi:hypothetical protein